jgi:hypothetical protein
LVVGIRRNQTYDGVRRVGGMEDDFGDGNNGSIAHEAIYEVKGKGSTALRMPNDYIRGIKTVWNVRVKKNLNFAQGVTKQDVLYTFDDKKCEIWDKTNNEIMVRKELQYMVYISWKQIQSSKKHKRQLNKLTLICYGITGMGTLLFCISNFAS